MKKALKLYNHSGKICKRCNCGRKEQMEKTDEQKLVEKWSKTGLLDEFQIDEEKEFVSQLLENQAVHIVKIGGQEIETLDVFYKSIIMLQLPIVVRVARDIIRFVKEKQKPLKAMSLPSIVYEEKSVVAHTKRTSARLKREELLTDFNCMNIDLETIACAKIAYQISNFYKKLVIEENKNIFPYTILIPVQINENEYGFFTRVGEIK